MFEFISQYNSLIVLALSVAGFIYQRKKHKVEIERIKAATKKTELENESTEKNQKLKFLNENIESMEGLVEYVQTMGQTVLSLQKKVTGLESDKLHISKERDICKETCHKLELKIKTLSTKITQLENTMKKHNIPLGGN